MQRYSVDLHNAHEDAVIPLSTVEADGVFDATPEKGAPCATLVSFTEQTWRLISVICPVFIG